MNDSTEIWRSAESDLLQRVATLEERTRPRPKTFLEQLQAYGGLIALVITVGYSFPLGVWDRFVVDQQKSIDAKLGEIRESLNRATGLSVEVGRLQSSISNPELRDLVTRSTGNQLLLLINKYDADYSKYRDKLFPDELLVIGHMYQSLFRIEDSLRYFVFAMKHQKASEISVLEANRQIAKSYFFPSPIQDLVKARNIYKSILPKSLQSPRLDIVSQATLIQSEWGFLEMTAGDWLCGVENMDAAIDRLKQMQPLINDQGNMVSMLSAKRDSLSLRMGQPQTGC